MGNVGGPTSKVLFRVVGDEGDMNVETLWAFDLGDDRYRLDNTPFYAYSVSLGDVVYAPADPDDGRPTYHSVLEKSGNRTIRVFFDDPIQPGSESDRLLHELVTLGCEFEGANKRYIAVTVPPRVELATVRDFLVENALTWEHADPSYSELFPNDA
jgi:Domain of unknown function (DUF4265)